MLRYLAIPYCQYIVYCNYGLSITLNNAMLSLRNDNQWVINVFMLTITSLVAPHFVRSKWRVPSKRNGRTLNQRALNLVCVPKSLSLTRRTWRRALLKYLLNTISRTRSCFLCFSITLDSKQFTFTFDFVFDSFSVCNRGACSWNLRSELCGRMDSSISQNRQPDRLSRVSIRPL